MSINKIEIQDGSGNVYYPKTSIDSVIYSDNTSIEEKIIILERKLIELKSQLANSINNKTGSSLTSNSTVDEMAAIINSIKTLEQATADANATASNILVDKTAYVNGTKITGTMPNKGTVTQSLSANGSLTLPSGYYDSIKITQNIPNRGEYQMAGGIGSGDDYIALNKIPYGYYPQSSNGWAPEIRAKKTDIAKTFGITADKIVKGNNILGVAGTATIGSLGGKNYKSGTTTGFKTYDTDTGSPNHYPMATYSIKINISFTPKVLVVKDSNGKLLALATVGYSFYYFDSPWSSGNFKHGWKEAEPGSLNNKNIYIREIAKYSGSFSDTYNSGETLTWEAWA